jgi:hypothetical protein
MKSNKVYVSYTQEFDTNKVVLYISKLNWEEHMIKSLTERSLS